MEECMNQPTKKKRWYDTDIIADYKTHKDMLTVACIYQITLEEVRSILKRNGML